MERNAESPHEIPMFAFFGFGKPAILFNPRRRIEEFDLDPPNLRLLEAQTHSWPVRLSDGLLSKCLTVYSWPGGGTIYGYFNANKVDAIEYPMA
jgi:hypothetical protein